MKVLSIIIKDFKTILSDKQAIILTMLMPIILMTILSLALKGSFIRSNSLEIERINIAVVKKYNENSDNIMFEKTLKKVMDITPDNVEINPDKIFFEDFLESKEVSKLLKYTVAEEKDALELLNKGEVAAVIVLPDKFLYNMKINLITPFRNNVDIKVLTHADKSMAGEIVTSVMEAYADSMSSVIIGKNVLIESVSANDLGQSGYDNMEEIMEGMSSLMKGISINIENTVVEGRESVTSSEYYAVAMMSMFILFAAGQGGRMLLEEKDNQTYQRMVIADISKTHILAGKFFTVFLIASVQILIMIAFSYFALKVKWKDFSSIFIISITSAFAVAGLGIFIGSLTYSMGNYKLANTFENVIIQIMALLGGSFFPLDLLPDVIQKLGFLSLNGVALKAFLKIILGYSIRDISKNILTLAITGTIFTILALIIFNKEESVDVKHNKITSVKA
jgi:ABC-2 type transport system permease protein